MARIFQKAQETILFQDVSRSQSTASKMLLPCTPRKALRAVAYSRTKPCAERNNQPFLPALMSVGRLSEEFSANLQETPHVAETLRLTLNTSKTQLDGGETPHPLHDTGFHSNVIARNSPSKQDVSALVAASSPFKPSRTDADSWNNDDKSLATKTSKPLPTSPVDAWLEGVFDNQPVEPCISQGTLFRNYSAVKKFPTFADILAASGVRRRPTVNSTASEFTGCNPTPIPSKEPSRSTSLIFPKLFRRQNFSGDVVSEVNSLRSSSSDVRRIPGRSQENSYEDEVEPLEVARTRDHCADNEGITPLTPEVEQYRKGKGPKRQRCASYYDTDVVLGASARSRID